MKKLLLPVWLVLILLSSCGVKPINKVLSYENITILSDMSSRLSNFPQKDTAEIRKIVAYFKDECVRPGERIGDNSSISFSTFSGGATTSVDIGKINNLGEKMRFVNSKGEYEHTGLAQKLVEFENVVSSAYDSIRNPGLDLVSMLMEKIENESIIKAATFQTNGIDTTFVNYINRVYIFTDGYLEYKDKLKNDEFYFGVAEVDKVRQYCKDHKLDVPTALNQMPSLGLSPYHSEKNKCIHLHIMETHERDRDARLLTYKYPKGLRDNEILKAVWGKWALDSGFKEFVWKKY